MEYERSLQIFGRNGSFEELPCPCGSHLHKLIRYECNRDGYRITITSGHSSFGKPKMKYYAYVNGSLKFKDEDLGSLASNLDRWLEQKLLEKVYNNLESLRNQPSDPYPNEDVIDGKIIE